MKENVEENLLWKNNVSNASLWWVNWTEMGAIVQIILVNDSQPVKDIILSGQWHIGHMQFPEFLAELILSIHIADPSSRFSY